MACVQLVKIAGLGTFGAYTIQLGLAPSDFHPFGLTKKFLGSKKFDFDDKHTGVSCKCFFLQPKEFYETETFKLIHCRDECFNMYENHEAN